MFDGGFPISVVKMNQTHNIARGRWANVQDGVFYIGRGSPLGNPYSTKKSAHEIRKVETKEEAIERFEFDLKHGKLKDEAYMALELLKDEHERGCITLVCFCKPEACHGDVIRKYLEELC